MSEILKVVPNADTRKKTEGEAPRFNVSLEVRPERKINIIMVLRHYALWHSAFEKRR